MQNLANRQALPNPPFRPPVLRKLVPQRPLRQPRHVRTRPPKWIPHLDAVPPRRRPQPNLRRRPYHNVPRLPLPNRALQVRRNPVCHGYLPTLYDCLFATPNYRLQLTLLQNSNEPLKPPLPCPLLQRAAFKPRRQHYAVFGKRANQPVLRRKRCVSKPLVLPRWQKSAGTVRTSHLNLFKLQKVTRRTRIAVPLPQRARKPAASPPPHLDRVRRRTLMPYRPRLRHPKNASRQLLPVRRTARTKPNLQVAVDGERLRLQARRRINPLVRDVLPKRAHQPLHPLSRRPYGRKRAVHVRQ